MAKEKKTYKVVGVGFDRAIGEVASDLEQQMNGFEDDGYSTEVMSVKDGLLVVGRRNNDEDQKSPFRGFSKVLDILLSPEGSGGGVAMTRTAARLLNAIQSRMGDSWITSYESELPKVIPSVLKDAPVSIVAEVAKELDACADTHDKDHDHEHNKDCPTAGFLRSVAKHMRAHATRNVQ
jgi:hypothetical protein